MGVACTQRFAEHWRRMSFTVAAPLPDFDHRNAGRILPRDCRRSGLAAGVLELFASANITGGAANAMTDWDMTEGEVLWIEPSLWRRAHCPRGFPFLVMSFAGRGDHGRVWVRGVVLDDKSGVRRELLTLCVPLTQPRARRVDAPSYPAVGVTAGPQAPPADLPDVAAGSVHSRQRGEPPPGYRRKA